MDYYSQQMTGHPQTQERSTPARAPIPQRYQDKEAMRIGTPFRTCSSTRHSAGSSSRARLAHTSVDRPGVQHRTVDPHWDNRSWLRP